jgi:hypothetical protein
VPVCVFLNLIYMGVSKSPCTLVGKGGYLVSCTTECIQLNVSSAFNPTPLNQRGAGGLP